MAASIVDTLSSLRVSSVLNRDVKQFGKKHLIDGQDDTCWNSGQGSPQWIHAELGTPSRLAELHIQFQGGFAGRECWVEGSRSPADDLHKIVKFYPEDINSLQIVGYSKEPSWRDGSFEYQHCMVLWRNMKKWFGLIFNIPEDDPVSTLRIVFSNSTDFFGRITVYKLDITGKPG